MPSQSVDFGVLFHCFYLGFGMWLVIYSSIYSPFVINIYSFFLLQYFDCHLASGPLFAAVVKAAVAQQCCILTRLSARLWQSGIHSTKNEPLFGLIYVYKIWLFDSFHFYWCCRHWNQAERERKTRKMNETRNQFHVIQLNRKLTRKGEKENKEKNTKRKRKKKKEHRIYRAAEKRPTASDTQRLIDSIFIDYFVQLLSVLNTISFMNNWTTSTSSDC